MIDSKYWNLSYTLTISFIVLVIFTITQSLVVLFLTSQNSQLLPNVYETLVYSNLGLISSISSTLGLFALLFFIKIKNKELTDYLNLIIPKLGLFFPLEKIGDRTIVSQPCFSLIFISGKL